MKPVSSSEFFFFSRATLLETADRHRAAYQAAQPFPHLVIDDFLPESVAAGVADVFPGLGDIRWNCEGPGDSDHTHDLNVEKATTSDEEQFPGLIRYMMMQFQSGVFMDFLGRLTGVDHLQPDPHHHGCGLHSTGRGGRLMVHLDASRHPNRDMNQLLNCIYYCTPDWRPEWGGELELWNEDATQVVSRVAPKFNRLAIFQVSGRSWHGHPHPLACPPGVRRNSLALYYYTTDEAVTGYEYSNFVRWKAVTEHDRPTGLHRMKALIRDSLPTPAVNAIAKVSRATGLNFKPWRLARS